MKTNQEIDSYIKSAPQFLRSILSHFRDLIHECCPEVVEKMRWGFPQFYFNEEMMCSFAGFRDHCCISFWKGQAIKDLYKLNDEGRPYASVLCAIDSKNILPPDDRIKSWITEAMSLNTGIIVQEETSPPKSKEPEPPDYFLKELKKNKKARTVFENFSPKKKREYIEWITEAKTEDTRNKRVASSLEWLSEGKARFWKYEKK